MGLFKRTIPQTLRIITNILFWSQETVEIHKVNNFLSERLSRKIQFDIFLPPGYFEHKTEQYPLLVFNDGQDLEAVKMAATLDHLYKEKNIQKIIVVGIYAGDRLQEYGTARQLDYQQRGSKSMDYSSFILNEFLPFMHQRYRISNESADYGFAGFSLGGLSALDMVWNHSNIFKTVGVFSGSLWWRSKPYSPENPDANRIMHTMVAADAYRQGLRFWFQAGTEDEKADRNNNGIIDAIDDTLQLMDELERKGYQRNIDFTYVQVEGGEHNPATWAAVLPEFLKWAYQPK